MLAAELCLHTEKRGSAETHSLLVYSTNDKATSRRHKKRDVRQTYRVDNAFESVEAIFDRKHMVFGVRNFSKLLVSRKNGVNREQCWFNTAFFFFSLWLSSVFPFILWAGGDKQMAWLWQTLCSTIKKKNCSTNWEQHCHCFWLKFSSKDRLPMVTRDRPPCWKSDSKNADSTEHRWH